MRNELETLIYELDYNKKAFDLDGVEITEEDAIYVETLMKRGYSKEDAIKQVLNGIYECLNYDL